MHIFSSKSAQLFWPIDKNADEASDKKWRCLHKFQTSKCRTKWGQSVGQSVGHAVFFHFFSHFLPTFFTIFYQKNKFSLNSYKNRYKIILKQFTEIFLLVSKILCKKFLQIEHVIKLPILIWIKTKFWLIWIIIFIYVYFIEHNLPSKL